MRRQKPLGPGINLREPEADRRCEPRTPLIKPRAPPIHSLLLSLKDRESVCVGRSGSLSYHISRNKSQWTNLPGYHLLQIHSTLSYKDISKFRRWYRHKIENLLSLLKKSNKNKLQPGGSWTLSNVIWNINMFIPLLLIRNHLLFSVHDDLNPKK